MLNNLQNLRVKLLVIMFLNSTKIYMDLNKLLELGMKN